MSKETWPINLRATKEERERIKKAYRDRDIPLATRILRLLREDVAKLKREK
jgi:hypothetical protein